MTTPTGKLGTASLELRADGTKLSKDLDKAQKATTQKIGAAGAKLTKTLTPAVAAVGAAFFAATEEMDAAFKVIQTGTGASGEALDGLKSDFEAVFGSVNADAQTVAANLADLNTRLGLTGEALQKATASASEMGINVNEVAQTMDIFGESGDHAALIMDNFFVASQTTGISMGELTGQLQTFGPVLNNLGLSLDESTALLGQLNAAGVDVTRVMPGINAFMRKAADEGVTDLSAALDRVIEDMKGADSNAHALNIATSAFGAEGAQRMVTAVDAGAFSLGDLVDKLQTSEGAIMANAEATRTNTERLKMMRQEISEKLAGALASLPVPLQAAAVSMGGLATALGPAMMGVPAAASGLKSLKSAASMANLTRLLGALTNPIGIALIAFGILAAIAFVVWQNWDTIKGKLLAIWDALAGRAETTAIKIKDFFQGIGEGIVGGLKAAINAIIRGINTYLEGVGRLIGLVKEALDKVPGPNPAGNFLNSVVSRLRAGVPALAKGGIVLDETLAIVGDVPEAVIPLDKIGEIMKNIDHGGARTVEQHFHIEGLLDMEGLISIVGEADVELDRRGRERVF